MAEEIRQPDGRIENPSVRSEPSDASFGPILAIVVGALFLGFVIHFVVAGLFNHERGTQDEIKKSPFPLAPGPSTALPREPRLEQVDRLAGVERPNEYLRESANLEVLNSYGPTAADGFVHVPIERAMQYLVEGKKLKARPPPPADQTRRSGGLVDAGGPNSGREFNRGVK